MTAAILVTGGGGVGKTTVSAAIGVAAARRGLETLVLTVDPARRLANALGLAELGAEPSKVQEEPLLWAAMLDASSSWEAIARRHADPTRPFPQAILHRACAERPTAPAEEQCRVLFSGHA